VVTQCNRKAIAIAKHPGSREEPGWMTDPAALNGLLALMEGCWVTNADQGEEEAECPIGGSLLFGPFPGKPRHILDLCM
jgi:hypothetical protein